VHPNSLKTHNTRQITLLKSVKVTIIANYSNKGQRASLKRSQGCKLTPPEGVIWGPFPEKEVGFPVQKSENFDGIVVD